MYIYISHYLSLISTTVCVQAGPGPEAARGGGPGEVRGAAHQGHPLRPQAGQGQGQARGQGEAGGGATEAAAESAARGV